MQERKKSVMIVDDHAILREGLRFMLSQLDHVEVIGEASNGSEFLRLIDTVQPDVVLMDINMPVMNGVEATRNALNKFPGLKILILSMMDDEEYYHTLLKLGVSGFILKTTTYAEIQSAIDTILQGKPYFSQELLLKMIRQRDEAPMVKLTGRETEILTLICKGFSNADISERLFISIRTVEKHRSELLLKTESNNSISLVVYAIKNRLVEI
jgi:DNA-binding NarL/FixJ family response regulator